MELEVNNHGEIWFRCGIFSIDASAIKGGYYPFGWFEMKIEIRETMRRETVNGVTTFRER